MSTKTTSGSTAGKTTTLVLICFFLSGVTGLIYEILWMRMIVKIIGGAPFAVSLVLTVFMGGLGLGSFLAGRTIDRVRESGRLIKIYGVLELIVAAYGLAIPLLLTVFRGVYAVIYNQLFGHFILYNFLTFVGCSLVLCIPVICMGATLPILCRFYITRLSHLGAHAGRLYGLNTIGAAMGALLCGFWLINHLGMRGTLVFAVVINAVIGLVCVLVGTRTAGPRAAGTKTPAEESAVGSEFVGRRAVQAGALLIFGVSGFCAMAYEVIWTKLLGLVVGPTTYSFTIVLVSFILGLALGSMIFGWLADKTGRPVQLLIWTQIVAAVFVLGVSQLMGNSQLFFAKLIFGFREQFGALHTLKAAVLLAWMIVPTLCLGATFPLVGKIYTQSVSKVGRSIGYAYAINTIGAVSGSFCAGFVLIPLIGKEKGLSLVVGMQLLTALAVAFVVFGRKKLEMLKLAGVAATVAAGLLLCLVLPAWNHQVLSSGKYHRFGDIEAEIQTTGWLEALLRGPRILTQTERAELVYYGDGVGGFTTVLKHTDPLGMVYYAMANSGKMDASSRGDMQTQTLLAHLPMLFHRDAKTVMILGLASGITAGEVLCYPVEQVDVLEINREVIAGSDYFLEWNNGVVSHERTNLIIQDARAHLQLTSQKYDVIISEPSNPWMAGLATLFTREFFELAEDRLEPEGIFVQFLHSYEMNWETFAMVGRAFVEVFPSSILVLTEPANIGGDYLFVGFKGEERLVLENARRNLEYARQSRNVDLRDARLLYRMIVTEDLKRLFGEGHVNSDNWPRLEFGAPKLMYTRDTTITQNIQARQWFSAATHKTMQEVCTDVDAQIDFAACALSVHAPFGEMVNLSRANAVQKSRFFEMMENYCARETIDFAVLKNEELIRKCASVQIRTLTNEIERMPDKALSYRCLGDLYLVDNKLDEAVTYYDKSLQINAERSVVHFNLAVALTRSGPAKLDEAILHFNEALRLRPALALKTHRLLGDALSRYERLGEAAAEYEKLLKLQGEDAGIHNALGILRARQGRLEKAVEHFEAAVRLSPGWEEAQRNLRLAQAQLYQLRKGTGR